MTMRTSTWLAAYGAAALIRYCLILSNFREIITESVAVSTPLNSWKRVTEGLHLLELNIYPYVGDSLHEPPLNLAVYNILVKLFGNHLYIVFIICEMLTSYLLHFTAKTYMQFVKKVQIDKENSYAESSKVILLTETDFTTTPDYVTLAYLFNPYTIFSCVGYTTTVFENLFLAIFLTGLSTGNMLICAASLVLCISKSFYPVLLISPLFMYCLNIEKSKRKAFGILAAVTLIWILLTFASYCEYNNLDFLNYTYTFILEVPDLHPNIGLFWYFFIEMFEHFRLLFIYAFQINVTLLYFIPLSVRFRNDPILLSASLLALFATFKSYPSIGDVGFVLSLLVSWKHLIKYYQQGFVVACCFFISTALAPTVWFLWIYSGSANANFFFGATLAFATAQIFLITDLLFAYIKREFILTYGYIKGGDNNILFLLQ